MTAGLGFELGEDSRGLSFGLQAAFFGLGFSIDDNPGLLRFGRRFELRPLLGLDSLRLGQCRLRHSPVLNFDYSRLGLALATFAAFIRQSLLLEQRGL